MTRWNDFVSEFAEKKNIAYGCAIVRNDLRKAYNKKYEPVPRNRGIYNVSGKEGFTGKSRKMRRPATEEEAKASALKRTATFKKLADAREEAIRKANPHIYDPESKEYKERIRKEEEYKARQSKPVYVRSTPEQDALLAKQLEIIDKASEELKAKERADSKAKADKAETDRIAEINRKYERVRDAKDIGEQGALLNELDAKYIEKARKVGGGLFLFIEKNWRNVRGMAITKTLKLGGYDLDLDKQEEFGYLSKPPRMGVIRTFLIDRYSAVFDDEKDFEKYKKRGNPL
jgi:hypothetical protein